MELHAQPSIGDTNAGMSETRNNDNLSIESKPQVAKTKGKEDQPTRIQEEVQPSLSMESSSNNGDINLSTGDGIYDADISADLDNLLLDGPVEI